MELNDLAQSIVVNENSVNASPQLIDADVTFVHDSDDFDGGTLTVSGLLAEDRVSIASGATISLVAGVVYYDADGAGGAAAVAIGTASGGSGATFTVTFNSAATAAVVEAVIESLTYANVSDTPTTFRALTIDVTDGVGESLTLTGSVYARLTGAANPFDGISVGSVAAPTLADLDGDGDLDATVGWFWGDLRYYENTGTAAAPVFVQQTGAANPFDGIDVGFCSSPTFADVDGDGDLDLVVGSTAGTLSYFENTGSAAAPVFVERTGLDNPFSSVGVGGYSTPAFADLDGDGDLDLVVGDNAGNFAYRENTGSATVPQFVAVTGAANPFDGIDIGTYSAPTFADIDGDGDLDVITGTSSAIIYYLENTGDASAPAFTLRLGAASPFDGMSFAGLTRPTFGSLDGDPDIVIGTGGALVTLDGGAPLVGVIVNAQADAPSASGLPTDVTVTEDVASDLDLSAVAISDTDTTGSISVILTASAGTMTATSGGGVTVSNSGTGAITLTGTASAIDTFLNTASAVQYTGAANAYGNNAATITVTANDGSGAVTLGTVNVDITAVDDPMSLTGVATTVSFNENTVNATPQLLDAAVTFAQGDSGFSGGTLTVSGLLAEDRVSIASGATISLVAGVVYYDADGAGGAAAVAIGTASGGSGATFTVTFNAAATATAIEALIESLTYANVSDTPTASRDLTINMADDASEGLAGAPTGIQITVSVTAEADGPTPFPDTLTGTSGNDTVKGLGDNDTLDGGDGNDSVEGGDGDDDLTGGLGNDRLDGGAGADMMLGGGGDDLYYVSDVGDVVDETGGSGYDTVRAMISFVLPTDVEQLELLFSAPINGTGNSLNNVIVGNTAANVLTGLAGDDTLTGGSGADTLRGGDDNDSLDGGAGNDTLEGGAGTDTLVGGAGIDRLDGGTGADSMTGGASGDTYVVDDSGDTVIELAGGGTDSVEASVSYTLAAEVENLTLTGGTAIDGTGNALANTITGNGAANILSGGGGADVLSGLGGDDRLAGGAGSDSLTGGTGADVFVFGAADIGSKPETDKILDLLFADGDVIDLSAIDANTGLGGDQAFAFVTRFTKQAGQAIMSYANGVTTLQLDVNGDGKADFKVTITGDVTGSRTNLYTGGGDTDGGWVL